ncbi:alpha/beta hydrolase [Virgisporangium aurantiacum]|nr:alpha/beta hydrolase [Virgisporangium aurantiacum]
MAEAVVIPGGGYGVTTGMLWYAGEVAARRGATVHRHSWTEPAPDAFDATVETWVTAQLAPTLTGRPLLIGKSLGSAAAALAADRGLPAVWLTPLLTAPWVVAALGRATRPVLLVGGTADRLWDGATARRLTPHVVEVADADHGLCVPGPMVGSVNVLARVIAAMDEFLDAISWPG